MEMVGPGDQTIHTTDHPWYLNESPMVLYRHVPQNISLILSLWLVECLILSPPSPRAL
jgi:hypothetical protein